MTVSDRQLQDWLKQLRLDEAIHCSGPTKSARWFPGPPPTLKARQES